MKYETISDAAHRWVGEFNAIPQSIIAKLIKLDPDEVTEITPPGSGDQVCLFTTEHNFEYGYIIGVHESDDNDTDRTLYDIRLDEGEEVVTLDSDDFEVQRDDYLPMWGTMWSFGDSADDYWLEKFGGLQIMANCGFRIYEQEDVGYLFGIDGAGYDFYEAHWIPLYKARGLHWHSEPEPEPETTEAETRQHGGE